MKLLLVTVVNQYQEEILRLFKEAQIEHFSGSEIDGYNTGSLVMTNS